MVTVRRQSDMETQPQPVPSDPISVVDSKNKQIKIEKSVDQQFQTSNTCKTEIDSHVSSSSPENKQIKIEKSVDEQSQTSNTCKTQSDAPVSSSSDKVLSKRQLRKQAKREQWDATKHLRIEKRLQKKKEFKERRKQYLNSLREKAEMAGLEPKSITDPNSRKKLKSNSMSKSSCKVGICVDMSFSDLMIEKDLHKCIKQLSRCYSINRRYDNPVQYHITSFTGKSVDVIKKHDGWKNWDVHFSENTYLELEAYPKDKIVYLTAESDNVLKEPEDGKLYVIGGLVDHNSKKGLCHQLALEKGVQHARLPLDEYIEMSARKVLSIDHVFEIIGGVTQNQSWEDILLKVLPPRKEPKLKKPKLDLDLSVQNSGSDSGDDEHTPDPIC